MKFSSISDIHLFLIEVGKPDKITEVNSLNDYTPTNEEMDTFVKRRKGVEKQVKDAKKKSDSKKNWRQNRNKMMKGIKKFHKSTEGKRFHRRLGKFLVNRETGGRLSDIAKDQKKAHDSVKESTYSYLKALNSLKTHLYIELEYYHTLFEQIEIDEFIFEYSFPMISEIESKLIKGLELTLDEQCFLYDIVEASALIKSFADKTGKSVSEIEGHWDKIKSSLLKQGKKESDERFYGLVVHILKNKLNLT